MKILLLTLPNRSYLCTPSLGLGYLAAIARKAGHEVEVLNCLKDKVDSARFEHIIRRKQFGVIGIQIFTFDLDRAKEFIHIINSVDPRIKTVVGGYHPTGVVGKIFNDVPQADFAFYSDAEVGFAEFLNKVELGDGSFDSVPNLIWKKDGTVKVNPSRLAPDLDAIPFPAWDLPGMDPRNYPPAPHGGFAMAFPAAPMIVTRGCPLTCTFCTAGKSLLAKELRERSVGNVMEEINLLVEKYGVRHILFEDENLALHKRLLVQLCERLIREKTPIRWSCPSGVRLDTMDRELLKLMKASGCDYLSVGVEFGSARMLKYSKKKLSLETIKEKTKLVKEAGITITGFFLMGMPTETREEMLETIKFARSLPIDFAQFNNFMPLPGSEAYDQVAVMGGLNNIDTNKYFVHDVSYSPTGVSRKELKNLQRRAYLEFYLRPRILLSSLKHVRSLGHFMHLFGRFIDALA